METRDEHAPGVGRVKVKTRTGAPSVAPAGCAGCAERREQIRRAMEAALQSARRLVAPLATNTNGTRNAR